MKHAVLLIAHGSPAKDMPRALLAELRALHKQSDKSDAEREREHEVERQIRAWPRNENNDPYGRGTQALVHELRALLDGVQVVAAYNEFSAPSIEVAIAQLVADGVNEVDVLTTMMTPGGGHSEHDIPEALARCRERFTDLTLTYRWPFDPKLVAQLLQRHLAAH